MNSLQNSSFGDNNTPAESSELNREINYHKKGRISDLLPTIKKISHISNKQLGKILYIANSDPDCGIYSLSSIFEKVDLIERHHLTLILVIAKKDEESSYEDLDTIFQKTEEINSTNLELALQLAKKRGVSDFSRVFPFIKISLNILPRTLNLILELVKRDLEKGLAINIKDLLLAFKKSDEIESGSLRRLIKILGDNKDTKLQDLDFIFSKELVISPLNLTDILNIGINDISHSTPISYIAAVRFHIDPTPNQAQKELISKLSEREKAQQV